MNELTGCTVSELQTLLARGEVSSSDITSAYLDRIQRVEPVIQAYVTVTSDIAQNSARDADSRIARGEAVSLTGIPLGIKDLICTRGTRTTCSSRMLENFVPPYNATVMDRLDSQGAVMLGKLNMDEFAMGSSTENSAFKKTHNPWNIQHIPGGSSGGSAASVAAAECPAALGSDTGGSIRQPASHCGVVGMKPTYGRVSRFGLVAFASSLDQIGPLTRDVTDCAILLEAISGHDPRDSTSAAVPVPNFRESLREGLEGVTVGVPSEYFVEGLDPDVENVVRQGIKYLEEQGAEIKEVSLPHTEYAVATYYIIAPAEASSNLSRYDGVKYGHRGSSFDNLMEMYQASRSEGFGDEVKRRIMIGTYCLSAGYYDAFYKKASQVRTLIMQDFKKVFSEQGCDVIAAPVAPTPAFRLGDKTGDPLQMYLSDICTIPVNLAGIPAMSVPCGFSSDNMPIGLQLMADHFQEEKLLHAAYNLELLAGCSNRIPDIPAGD